MKSADVFPTKYVSAADLKDLNNQELTLKIDRMVMETLPDGTQKPAVYFHGTIKGLLLNKTNWGYIEDLYGDSDDWSGKKIQLYVDKVMFQNKLVPAVRVRKPPAVAPSGDQKRQYVATEKPRHTIVENVPAEDDDGDSIPF